MSNIFNEKDAKKLFDGFDSYTQDDADKGGHHPQAAAASKFTGEEQPAGA